MAKITPRIEPPPFRVFFFFGVFVCVVYKGFTLLFYFLHFFVLSFEVLWPLSNPLWCILFWADVRLFLVHKIFYKFIMYVYCIAPGFSCFPRCISFRLACDRYLRNVKVLGNNVQREV